jgi:hypothetical protein
MLQIYSLAKNTISKGLGLPWDFIN